MNDALTRMVGEWSGEGQGFFPGIDPFAYRETLGIEQPDETSLFYVQRSVRTTPTGEWVTSHWESGFIRCLDSVGLEMVNAHSGGRTEVLKGTVATREGRLVIDLSSTSISNDQRMIASSRCWEVDGDIFRYSLAMSTTRTADLTPHLTAVLRRDRK